MWSRLFAGSVTTAKFIGRGDYWRAQHWFAQISAADADAGRVACARQDTWYEGRYLEQWVIHARDGAQSVVHLDRTRADDSRHANMLTLFRTLGEETAARHSLTYPTAAHENRFSDRLDLRRQTGQ